MAGCGVGLGAGLMYVLDPEQGRRRRAQRSDRASHAAGVAHVTLDKRARDLGNRARGLVAGAGSHFRGEQVTDEVLANRVRSKMGRAVSKPGDVEVSASEGRVTLRGVVWAREAERLLRCVSRVRGVRGVESQLKLKRRHGEAPDAGRENGKGNGEHVVGRHFAPKHLLAAVAGSGLALYGAKRRGAFGAVLSVVGMRMLRHGLEVRAS